MTKLLQRFFICFGLALGVVGVAACATPPVPAPPHPAGDLRGDNNIYYSTVWIEPTAQKVTRTVTVDCTGEFNRDFHVRVTREVVVDPAAGGGGLTINWSNPFAPNTPPDFHQSPGFQMVPHECFTEVEGDDVQNGYAGTSTYQDCEGNTPDTCEFVGEGVPKSGKVTYFFAHAQRPDPDPDPTAPHLVSRDIWSRVVVS